VSHDAFNLGLEKLGMRHIKITPSFDRLVGAKVSSETSQGKFSHILEYSNLLDPVNFNNEQIISAPSYEPLVVVLSNPTQSSVEDLDYSIEPKSVLQGPTGRDIFPNGSI